MTPDLLREKVIAERSAWIRDMLDRIQGLPLESYEQFVGDLRNVGAAESYLRRAVEVLLDMGRHILAKEFALAVSEYKEIALINGLIIVLTFFSRPLRSSSQRSQRKANIFSKNR